jgi:hypothetical protein
MSTKATGRLYPFTMTTITPFAVHPQLQRRIPGGSLFVSLPISKVQAPHPQ